MDVDDELRACFGDYESEEKSQAWQDTKSSLQVGSFVSGKVVARRQFGIFVDIGIDFPALILVTRLKAADKTPNTSIESYPKIGDRVEARVYALVDDNRQIALTQLDNEPMLDALS